mgnify:CR=1 FL=1
MVKAPHDGPKESLDGPTGLKNCPKGPLLDPQDGLERLNSLIFLRLSFYFYFYDVTTSKHQGSLRTVV